MANVESEESAFKVRSSYGRGAQPPRMPGMSVFAGRSWGSILTLLGLTLAFGYLVYYWEFRRVVVDQGHVLVLLKKNGSKSLSGDQIIIPKPPSVGTTEYAEWEKKYKDCNGILEQVWPEGTYFQFSPFDYERFVIDLNNPELSRRTLHTDQSDGAIIPSSKVGIVVKKFGSQHLDADQILVDPARDQRGPMPVVLQPGRYNDYANPFAYQIKHVNPLIIEPGHRGVVTVMAGKRGKTALEQQADPDQYLVKKGYQGVQDVTELEGFRYVNPFSTRINPISMLSQQFVMSGADVIRFPSADSFEIQLEGFVEWSIDPEKLPLIYVQYGEGGGLIEYLEEKVILPYSRSFCRVVGSQFMARDFISGETKLKFQFDFDAKLREACKTQGIIVRQALVRNIESPAAIRQPINDRELAKEQILQYEQQILAARSQSLLTAQEEMANQNQEIGRTNKEVVTLTKKFEQMRDVALTKAQQELAVAKLKLAAAQKLADATVSKGKAEAEVILLQRIAEAEPLKKQVEAFGGGEAYARFFFYQKVAPSIKSILTNTEGPFADMFKQFATPAPTAGSQLPK